MTPPLSAPIEVTLEITNRCNLRCAHCFSAFDRRSRATILSDEELFQLGDEFARLKVFTVVLSGGEPLARPSFLHIASHFHQLGLDVGFSTNGTLVSDELANDLVENGLGRGVQVSLDGASPATHDQIRGPGAFGRTIRGIRALVAAGIRPSLGFTVMNRNVDEAEEVVRLAMREQCRHVHFIFLMPAGNALAAFWTLQPSPSRIARLVEDLERIQEWVEPEVTIDWANATHCPTGRGLRPDQYSEVDRAFAGCPAGKVSASIDCFGNVLGCDILRGSEFVAGNVRDRSFQAIWQSSKVFEAWRSRSENTIEGKCRGCYFLFACVGGCPAFSVFQGHDIFWGDPTCPRSVQTPAS